MNKDVKEILAYFEEYIKITDMHDSEPMLNWKDLKIVLDYINNLQEKLDKKEEVLMCAKFKIKALEELITNESAY